MFDDDVFDLTGRVALVDGRRERGSAPRPRCLLARHGADVAIAARTVDRSGTHVRRDRGGDRPQVPDRAHGCKGRGSGRGRWSKRTVDELGRLDILQQCRHADGSPAGFTDQGVGLGIRAERAICVCRDARGRSSLPGKDPGSY